MGVDNVNNSRYYLKKAVKERFEFLMLSIALAGIFSVLLLPVLWKLGMVYYSVVIVFVIIFMETNSQLFKKSGYLVKAKEEFLKEELIRTFHDSPGYYRYAKSKTDNVDEFISVMSKMVGNFKALDELGASSHTLAEYSYGNHIQDTIIHLLVNPELLKGNLSSFSDYTNETEILIKQYPYAVNPYAVTKNVHPDHIPNMGSMETEERLYELSSETLSALGDIIRNHNKHTIKSINNFVEIVRAGVSP